MTIKLNIEPVELDFICGRLVAGQMDFQTAMNAKAMVDKLVTQANDKALQEPPANTQETKDGQGS